MIKESGVVDGQNWQGKAKLLAGTHRTGGWVGPSLAQDAVERDISVPA
jgi:hypothetical protein